MKIKRITLIDRSYYEVGVNGVSEIREQGEHCGYYQIFKDNKHCRDVWVYCLSISYFDTCKKGELSMDIALSEKEQTLLDFIKTEDATIKIIEVRLGKEYVGALGKLIGKELIEGKKKKVEGQAKMVKYYTVKLPEEVKIKEDK